MISPSSNSKAKTRSLMKRRADIDVYSHPFNARLPGDVAKALYIDTVTTSTSVTDSERTCTTPVNKSLYPVVLPLWSPSSSASSSSSTENEMAVEVDFHTTIFGIAYDVAMSVLNTELGANPRTSNTPRPRKFLIKDVDSPSSNSETILPETDNRTALHPAYAARARWLKHRDDEQKKVRNPWGKRQVSRNWEPTRIGEYSLYRVM